MWKHTLASAGPEFRGPLGQCPCAFMFLGKVLGPVLWSPPLLSPVPCEWRRLILARVQFPSVSSLLRLRRCLQASSSCGGLCRAQALVRGLHG